MIKYVSFPTDMFYLRLSRFLNFKFRLLRKFLTIPLEQFKPKKLIVSVKKYDWAIHESLFTQTNQGFVFFVRRKIQKCFQKLKNISVFSTMRHPQMSHA